MSSMLVFRKYAQGAQPLSLLLGKCSENFDANERLHGVQVHALSFKTGALEMCLLKKHCIFAQPPCWMPRSSPVCRLPFGTEHILEQRI